MTTSRDIEKDLANQLTEELQKLKKSDFKEYQKKFFQLANTLRELNTQLTLYDFGVSRYQVMFDLSDATLNYTYKKKKKDDNIKKQQINLLEQSLEGYEYFQKFRQLLTGERITYQVASIGKTGNITEGSFTFQELKEGKFLKIQEKSSGYRIRLRASQKKIRESLGENVRFEKYDANNGGRSSLYSAVYYYYTTESLKNGFKLGNRGNFYETYRRLYIRFGRDNTIIPSSDMIYNAFKETLSNITSFAQGGDIGLQQDKIGNASFLDIYTLCNILQETAQSIHEAIQNKDSSIILNKLVKQNTGNLILQEAETKSKKIIDQKIIKKYLNGIFD